MDYKMVDLLPLVTELSKKYTSFESSSVSYETAQMLMEAVLYSMAECMRGKSGDLLSAGTKLPAKKIYEKGYEMIVEKTREAKGLYEQIVEDFQGYGCLNYEDTILRGMPAFFLHYDARFEPQNHILTLDYPVVGKYENVKGIDRIYKYLTAIRLEKMLLDQFDTERIQGILERAMPDGRRNFMDNICELVLFCAVECVICDCPIDRLELDAVDGAAVRKFFAEDNLDQAKEKISGIIRMIIRGVVPWAGDKAEAYFRQLSREFAVRITQSGFMP